MESLILVLSVLTLTLSVTPPDTWQENWFEHTQTVTKHYHDSDAAVYFDKEMDQSTTWTNTFLPDLWVYIKKTYGELGNDPHLYVIFHKLKYEGCHITTYFDASKLYRNVVDFGSLDDDAWSGKDKDLDFVIGCVGLILQNANHGVHGSPHFSICGHQWSDIFIYDVYKGLNRPTDAQRWYRKKVTATANSPRAPTYWFRDWFFPIYEQYGGSKVLNKFFELLAKYMPKSNTDSFERPKYARNMNIGEFVHFWSGTTQVNLKGMAREAFGWTEQYEREFQQARKDFPNITYYNIIL